MGNDVSSGPSLHSFFANPDQVFSQPRFSHNKRAQEPENRTEKFGELR
jgi:hypothetical protein